MTPEAQRIAIAEACGWKRRAEFDYEEWPTSSLVCRLKMYGKAGELKTADKLPDYLKDLNAMHEAEATLDNKPVDVRSLYIDWLGLIHKSDPMGPQQHLADYKFECAWAMVRATAAQRAEAFLKAKGLWKEDE